MEIEVKQTYSASRTVALVIGLDAIVSIAVLAILILAFARYMPLSGDITQHFMLVDELTKYGKVRTPIPGNLGLMALYPPGSHWVASIVGRIAGSSLIGITAVSIVSLFLCYRLIIKLIGESFTGAVIVFVILFALAIPTSSLIGWELYVNFFYPQLVADVLFFGMLVWLVGRPNPWTIVGVAAVVAYIAMWVQPLIALHLLGAALVLMAIEILLTWRAERRFPFSASIPLATLAIISMALVLFHPSLQAMRTISQHDGYLEFRYTHPTIVALLCGLVGAVNLWVSIRGRTDYLDRVLGASVLASVFLVLAQSAVLHTLHVGSLYAIKKHLFLAFTLGLLNAVRLISTVLQLRTRPHTVGWFVGPVLAGLLSVIVLRCFITPVAPIVAAVAYADSESTKFAPGTLVMRDTSLPPMINFMISQSSFQHPFDMTSISWMQGADPAKGATLVMAPRSQISDACLTGAGPSEPYEVVKPSCLIGPAAAGQ